MVQVLILANRREDDFGFSRCFIGNKEDLTEKNVISMASRKQTETGLKKGKARVLCSCVSASLFKLSWDVVIVLLVVFSMLVFVLWGDFGEPILLLSLNCYECQPQFCCRCR